MLNSLGNIMVTIATGLVAVVICFFVLAMLDEWLNGKTGRPFLSFGVVATWRLHLSFWWGGWWWQSAPAQSKRAAFRSRHRAI